MSVSEHSEPTFSLEAAIASYKQALHDLEPVKSQPSEQQVLAVLLARDAVEQALSTKTRTASAPLTQLIHLDEHLKAQSRAIAAVDLARWRDSLHPPESAWWWFLESPKRRTPWNNLDWLWNSLTVASLALSCSFAVTIVQSLSVSGINWRETFGAIAEGIGLVVVARSALTEEGQQKVKALLRQTKIPEKFYSEVTFGASLVILGATYGTYVYLPDYFYLEGQRYQQQGLLDKAMDHYKKAIRLDPENVTLYMALGEVCESLGYLEQAVEQYQQALARGNPEALNDLGRVLINRVNPVTRQRDPRLAEAFIRISRARLLDREEIATPIKYTIHRDLGWVLLEQEEYQEAEIELLSAIEQEQQIQGEFRGQGMAYCFLGHVYEAQGRVQAAQSLWTTCIERARPASMYEYRWFLQAGHSKVVGQIDTSAIVIEDE